MPSTPVNELGRFRTWHFTSVLQYSPDINLELERLASAQYSLDKVLSSYALARRHIEKQISQGPDCVTFVSCRFSRKDVAAWLSNAATRSASPDLPLEGYIQSKICIGLDRLHSWLENALWTNVGGKLRQNPAYKTFCEANDAYEYCNVGSHAIGAGGRPAKPKPSVESVRSVALRAFFVMPTMLFSRFL